MADPKAQLREISWGELFPWLILFRSVRIALLARVLVLGAIGLIVTTLGWRAINWMFAASDDKVLIAWRQAANAWIWESSPGFNVARTADSVREIVHSAGTELSRAPLDLWGYLTRPFQDLFRAGLTATGFLCLLLCCIWELLIWGIVGGAIARIAALRFTRGEAPGLVAAVQHSASKLLSFSSAPLIALAGAAVFAIQLFLLGIVMNLGFFAMLAGLVWPFVLLLGLLMAILLIGALLGWPLMWATVAVEGTDSFDALSRSYAYIYQRPWRLLWYVLVAIFIAAVSMFVVRVFAASAISLGDWSVDWGLNKEDMATVVKPKTVISTPSIPPPFVEPTVDGDLTFVVPPVSDTNLHWTEEVARDAIWFWKSLLMALAAGYQAGFLWVAAVGIYLLLRRDIDGAEMDEVFIDQQAEYGVPPLEGDVSTGVPEVSPGSPAQPGDSTLPN